MRISTIGYNIKQGLKNIYRNKMFSLASIATMAACIFLFGLFFAIVLNFRNIVQSAEESVGVTVFFDEGLDQTSIDRIGRTIGQREEVSKINFVSAEEAWEDYKEEYFDGSEEAAESFKGDNPLANSANYEVYLSDVSKQESLVAYIESLDGVRQVNKSEAVADTLSNFNVLIGYISAAIIIILFGVALFLISNTVTIGIAVRKEEIAIMKLIGAKDYFVRGPFIVEGVVIGLVGAAIPLAILYVLYNKVISYVMERFHVLTTILTFLPAGDVFRYLLPVGLVLGVGIGLIGSSITIRKHLKV